MKIDLPPEGINLVVCALDAMTQATAVIRQSIIEQATAQTSEKKDETAVVPPRNSKKK